MTRFEFNDMPFRCSHGVAPRGRGWWAFRVPGNRVPGFDKPFFAPEMTLADARRWAREHVKPHVPAGVHVVVLEVLP